MLLHPTQQLMEDHELILRVLDEMEKASQRVAQGGELHRMDWDYFIRFSREFSDGIHHHKEESMLFPAMIQAGLPLEEGPIPCMLKEHDQGREYLKNLAEALERFQGGDELARRDIVKNAEEYVYHLRQHIQKENQILFLMAERLLSLTEKKKLTDQMSRWMKEEKNLYLEKDFRSRFFEISTSG